MRVDGGVADDDVDVSKRPPAFLDQALQFFLAPHVAGEAQDREPLVGQLPLRSLDPARIPAGDDDPRAVLGERARDGLADTLGRAGDDGALAREVEEGGHGRLRPANPETGSCDTARPSAAPVYVNGAMLAYSRGLGVSRRCGGARMTAPHEAVQANGCLPRGGGRRSGTLPTEDANAR